jgi:hypothetical protein
MLAACGGQSKSKLDDSGRTNSGGAGATGGATGGSNDTGGSGATSGAGAGCTPVSTTCANGFVRTIFTNCGDDLFC